MVYPGGLREGKKTGQESSFWPCESRLGVMIEPAVEGAGSRPGVAEWPLGGGWWPLGPPQEMSGASSYREERWGRCREAWRALARASVNTV